MVEAREVWGSLLEKNLHCHEQTLKGDSGESLERRERWRKSLSRLRARGRSNSKQNVVEIWMTRAILMTEMRGVVLERGRGNPCYKVAKKLLKLCSCSSILWKIELGKDEMHT